MGEISYNFKGPSQYLDGGEVISQSELIRRNEIRDKYWRDNPEKLKEYRNSFVSKDVLRWLEEIDK